ncbi:hypothetical protein ACFXKW_35085 [Streptomyces sp. NPDC059193]|uniref:hypothetical protein n=1 Tax=Streptomyces sp. NPDC059193 TaxID=3346763 RepID=UPI003678D1E3
MWSGRRPSTGRCWSSSPASDRGYGARRRPGGDRGATAPAGAAAEEGSISGSRITFLQGQAGQGAALARIAARVRARGARCVASDGVAAGASRASAEEGALLLREVVRMTAAASATRNYLHGEMESAGNTLHLVYGDGRELEPARSLAGAGQLTLLITTAETEPAENLYTVRLPFCADAVRVVLETVVLQELVARLSAERGAPIESFVFANDDTKEGGLDMSDFEVAAYTPSG